jgi:hypothetical protein
MDGEELTFVGLFLFACLVMGALLYTAFTDESNPFRDDCEASHGTYKNLSGNEYCTINGEVYPR